MSYVKVADFLEKRDECPNCDKDQEKFRGAPMNHCITCPNKSEELRQVQDKIVHFGKLSLEEQEILEKNWKPKHLRTTNKRKNQTQEPPTNADNNPLKNKRIVIL